MINKTILHGRLTREPEARQTQGGTDVASFTVAWSEKYKDIEKKLFMPCVAWGSQALFVCRYFNKGSEIIVEGNLTSRKWQDKDGNNRETIELTAERIHFAGSKTDKSTEEETPAPMGFATDTDDEDLPF